MINYSCIQNWSFSYGVGNISDNPLFIDYDGNDGIVGTEDDNLKLDQISPCNDAANNNAVPLDLYDLDGDGNYEEPLPIDIISNPRFVDIEVKGDTGLGTLPIVDMGAYENDNIDFFIFENIPVQVQEGGQGEFTVALNADPLGPIEVFIEYREGDPDITITSGSLLTFDSSNYYIPQSVVLSAQEDSDHFNSSTKFKVFLPSVVEIDILAIENDDEHNPNILFVDKAAPLWAGVFTDLQEALDFAQGDPNICEIQIAQGTYKPDINPNKYASFHLINGVSLKGGYAGYGESEPYQRNLDLYTTVLSGDFSNNDVYGDNFFLSRQENAYHVIIGENIDATTSLDGLSITGGYPNDNSKGENSGGGIHLTRSNLLIKDIIFHGNAAYEKGAAIYNENGNPTISNCYFFRNEPRFSAKGGAIYIYNYCSPIITDCIFEDNKALDGGAIYTTYHGNFTALNCSFISNFSWNGGAIYMNNESTPLLNNCIFNYNSTGAYEGGAIYISNCKPNITNCQFNNNSAETSGGAIYDRNSQTNLTSCTFKNNTAISVGGAICTLDSESNYYNNEFKSNVADFNGGAIHIRGETSGDIEVARCKFFNNTAKNDGGAIYITGGLINYIYPQIIDCEIINNIALNNGGGIGHRNKTKPTYATCLITNNRANNDGGGINGGEITIQDCTIENNISLNGGGIANSAVTIEDSSISVNSAQNTGGALKNCSGTVKYCEIKENTSLNSGGGLGSCTCSLYNNLIIGNKALYGGALDNFQGKLQHCTVVHNSSIEGGGVRNSTGFISNCILWENYPNEIVNSTTPTYSCIKNWSSGGLGNISIDPEFVNLGSRDPNSTPDIPFDDLVVIGDYHLKSEGWRWDDDRKRWDYDDVTSRCIDSGNPGKGLNKEPLTIPEDPDNIWGYNIRVNMGLYGATAEASIAPHGWSLLADITNDGIVDINDLIVTAERWLSTGNEIPTDLSRDLKINMIDFAILAEEWSMNTIWFE